jgi:hypothetical protein
VAKRLLLCHAEPLLAAFEDQLILERSTQSLAIQWMEVYKGKGVRKMMKKLMGLFLVLSLVAAFSLPAVAQEIISGKIQALDKVGKKIIIAGTEYTLSDEAAQTAFKVGDAVEATVEGNNVVKKLTRLLQ